MTINFKQLLAKPQIVGVCGNINQGKSMLLYHILEELTKESSFNLFTYGLRLNFNKAIEIFSVEEMEQIQNSLIIIDELSSLFDLDNRKVKKQIENTLRLLNHNNNIIILCGTPENFKKFISAKLDVMIYKKTTLSDLINGSRVKNILINYQGKEKGSAVLNLNVEEALCFDGTRYNKFNVPYYKRYDSKSDNVPIFVGNAGNKKGEKMCRVKNESD